MAYTIISQNNTTTTLADENGNVITVPARVTLATSTDYTITKVNNNSVDLVDGNGKVIRGVPACVVLAGEGGGGGDSHNKGYYATQAALEEAHPTAEAGDWAIVGSTDTVWVWDVDTSAWVDTDTKGQVVSVNSKTGTVVLAAEDVGALPQYSTMPVASSSNSGLAVQYTGATNASYTHDYIYENVPTTTSSSASASQTVGSTLSDIAVDLATLEAFTGWTTDNSLQIFYTADGWSVDTTSLGVTYTGTPNVGDAITITYTAAVTTYAWTRVDVQPAGATIDDTSTSSLTATWSANKLNTTIGNVETLLAQI